MKGHRILVVDDDPSIQFFLGELLKKEGYTFDLASKGDDALEHLKNMDYSLVLLDERMPGISGLEVLERMRIDGYKMPVIMITAYGSKELAMKAIEEGAYDFFTKPVDIEVVRTVIKRALERYELQRELEELKKEVLESAMKYDLIAESPEMRKLIEIAKKVGPTDVTVLITGESGSGKELIAKTIWRLSDRKDRSFVSVNCAAIPETLLEAELFGYEKGAFTGAIKQHIGKFERASEGTIFLDEIGDLSLGLQAKLLRVLQEKEIERLGGLSPIKINVRLISATNKDLDEEMKNGRFRDDLLYRVRVFELKVPPLRERKEDIPILAEHFLKRYSAEIGKAIKGFERSAIKFFMSYPWPGNVREMENLIQRAIILENGDVIKGSTVLELAGEGTKIIKEGEESVKDKLTNMKEEEEKKFILDALIKSRWKRQKAAKILGISRKSLFNKMKKYGLQ